MAHPDHLKRFCGDVSLWNNWMRETVVETESDIDLTNADLRRVSMVARDLFRVNLAGADLSQTHWEDCSVTATNFTDAVLDDVTMGLVNFTSCRLDGARFRRARLDKTTFWRTTISRADFSLTAFYNVHFDDVAIDGNFSGATLLGCNFTSTDFRGAIGLDLVRVAGPNSFDVSSLIQFGAGVPKSLLLESGVSAVFVDYLPSLIGATSPLEFQSCFISFSSFDQIFANRLHASLRDRGVRAWFAPEDLKIGDRFRRVIDEAIHSHDRLLVVLSESSLNSAWVETEVEAALDRERRENRTILFPIAIDGAVFDSSAQPWAAHLKRTRHIGDFSGHESADRFESALKRLLKDLIASDRSAPSHPANQE